MQLDHFTSLHEVPTEYWELLEEAGTRNFFHSPTWFRCLAETAMEAGDQLHIYGSRKGGPDTLPQAMIVARASASRRLSLSPRTLASFENFFTIQSGPIVSSDCRDPASAFRTLVKSIMSDAEGWDSLSFKAIDISDPYFELMKDGLRRSGLWIQPYFQFANWYDRVEGLTFAKYLSARGKSVRQRLMSKSRRLERTGQSRYELVTGGPGLEQAIIDYQKVYEGSWKDPEQFPEFIPRLIRECAKNNTLRMGMIYFDEKPVATQLTFIANGTAFQYKLAYDENILDSKLTKNLSIGAILLLRTMEHLIDVDKVKVVDFGIGEERYKADWLTCRREKWGIVAFNPRRLKGILHGMRHLAPVIARNLVKSVLPDRQQGEVVPTVD